MFILLGTGIFLMLFFSIPYSRNYFTFAEINAIAKESSRTWTGECSCRIIACCVYCTVMSTKSAFIDIWGFRGKTSRQKGSYLRVSYQSLIIYQFRREHIKVKARSLRSYIPLSDTNQCTIFHFHWNRPCKYTHMSLGCFYMLRAHDNCGFHSDIHQHL